MQARRWCNGSRWQVFTAKQVDGTKFYEWVNAATGDVMSAAGIGHPVTGVKPPSEPGLASSRRSPPNRIARPGAPRMATARALSRSRPGDPRA
jgi:hypothetical protein